MTREEEAVQEYKSEDYKMGIDVLLTDNSCVNHGTTMRFGGNIGCIVYFSKLGHRNL